MTGKTRKLINFEIHEISQEFENELKSIKSQFARDKDKKAYQTKLESLFADYKQILKNCKEMITVIENNLISLEENFIPESSIKEMIKAIETKDKYKVGKNIDSDKRLLIEELEFKTEKTALYLACEQGLSDIARLIVDKISEFYGQAKVIELLTAINAKSSVSAIYLLAYPHPDYINKDHIDNLASILEIYDMSDALGTVPEKLKARDKSPLNLVLLKLADKGCLKGVRSALKMGANYAVTTDQIHVFRWWHPNNKINPDPKFHGVSPLYLAAENGHEKIVNELLLQAKEDRENYINKICHIGYSFFWYTKNNALHIAAINGHTEIVEILLKNGANICIQNGDGNTAIHLAILGQDTTVPNQKNCKKNKGIINFFSVNQEHYAEGFKIKNKAGYSATDLYQMISPSDLEQDGLTQVVI